MLSGFRHRCGREWCGFGSEAIGTEIRTAVVSVTDMTDKIAFYNLLMRFNVSGDQNESMITMKAMIIDLHTIVMNRVNSCGERIDNRCSVHCLRCRPLIASIVNEAQTRSQPRAVHLLCGHWRRLHLSSTACPIDAHRSQCYGLITKLLIIVIVITNDNDNEMTPFEPVRWQCQSRSLSRQSQPMLSRFFPESNKLECPCFII